MEGQARQSPRTQSPTAAVHRATTEAARILAAARASAGAHGVLALASVATEFDVRHALRLRLLTLGVPGATAAALADGDKTAVESLPPAPPTVVDATAALRAAADELLDALAAAAALKPRPVPASPEKPSPLLDPPPSSLSPAPSPPAAPLSPALSPGEMEHRRAAAARARQRTSEEAAKRAADSAADWRHRSRAYADGKRAEAAARARVGGGSPAAECAPVASPPPVVTTRAVGATASLAPLPPTDISGHSSDRWSGVVTPLFATGGSMEGEAGVVPDAPSQLCQPVPQGPVSPLELRGSNRGGPFGREAQEPVATLSLPQAQTLTQPQAVVVCASPTTTAAAARRLMGRAVAGTRARAAGVVGDTSPLVTREPSLESLVTGHRPSLDHGLDQGLESVTPGGDPTPLLFPLSPMATPAPPGTGAMRQSRREEASEPPGWAAMQHAAADAEGRVAVLESRLAASAAALERATQQASRDIAAERSARWDAAATAEAATANAAKLSVEAAAAVSVAEATTAAERARAEAAIAETAALVAQLTAVRVAGMERSDALTAATAAAAAAAADAAPLRAALAAAVAERAALLKEHKERSAPVALAAERLRVRGDALSAAAAALAEREGAIAKREAAAAAAVQSAPRRPAVRHAASLTESVIESVTGSQTESVTESVTHAAASTAVDAPAAPLSPPSPVVAPLWRSSASAAVATALGALVGLQCLIGGRPDVLSLLFLLIGLVVCALRSGGTWGSVAPGGGVGHDAGGAAAVGGGVKAD